MCSVTKNSSNTFFLVVQALRLTVCALGAHKQRHQQILYSGVICDFGTAPTEVLGTMSSGHHVGFCWFPHNNLQLARHDSCSVQSSLHEALSMADFDGLVLGSKLVQNK